MHDVAVPVGTSDPKTNAEPVSPEDSVTVGREDKDPVKGARLTTLVA